MSLNDLYAPVFMNILSSNSIDSFPLNENILFTYFSIFYKIEGGNIPIFPHYHGLAHASLFALHITRSVFRTGTPFNIFTPYVNHEIFREHIHIVMDCIGRRTRKGFPRSDDYIASLLHNTLKREDNGIKLLINVLKPYRINPILDEFMPMGVMALLTTEKKIERYVDNLLMLYEAFPSSMEYLVKRVLHCSYSCETKEGMLCEFLSIVLQKTQDKKTLKKIIKEKGKSLLTRKERSKLMFL